MCLSRGQRAKRERVQGQNGLFGSAIEDAQYVERVPIAIKPWTHTELLAAEKAALGFYITGHPLGEYVDLLQNLKAVKSIDLAGLTSGARVSVGGIIEDLQPRTTKKGDKFALLRLEDEFGGIKCVLWPESYRQHSGLLQNQLASLITGRLELSEENPPTIIVDQVQSLTKVMKNRELIVLRLPSVENTDELLDTILHLLNTNPGTCDVALEAIIDAHTLVRVKVNPALRVAPEGKLHSALKQLGCLVAVDKIQTSSSQV